MKKEEDMVGKVCVVTGANSGIGKEIALALAVNGAHVVAIDRDECNSLLKSALALGCCHLIESYVVDLSILRAVIDVADEILRRHQVIDVLVNNAGRHVISRETSVDGFEMCFALNCLASYALTRRLQDAIAKSGNGVIVNMASEAHRVPGWFDVDDINTERSPMIYAYGKSKFGLILWTKALAHEYQGRIRVNAVCPGLVATKIFLGILPEWILAPTRLLSKVGLMSSPAQGARRPLQLILDPDYSDITGKYFGSHAIMRLVAEKIETNSLPLQEAIVTKLNAILAENGFTKQPPAKACGFA